MRSPFFFASAAVITLGGMGLAAAAPSLAQTAAISYTSGAASSDDDQVNRALQQASELRVKVDFAGALSLCRHALAIDKTSCDAYAEMAETLAAQGQNAEALKMFREACGENRAQTWSSCRMQDGDLQFRFALFLLKEGGYEEAVKMYKVGYSVLPERQRTLVNGKFSSKELLSAPALRREFEAAVRTSLGIKYSELMLVDRAVSQFRTVLASVPGEPTAHYLLGNALLLKGRKNEAQQAWQVAASGSNGSVKNYAREALAQNR